MSGTIKYLSWRSGKGRGGRCYVREENPIYLQNKKLVGNPE